MNYLPLSLVVVLMCLSATTCPIYSADTQPNNANIIKTKPDAVSAVLSQQAASLRKAYEDTESKAEKWSTYYVLDLKNSLSAMGMALWPRRAKPTLVEQDPRYRANFQILFGSDTPAAQSSNRIWQGMPTRGYKNTVSVIVRGGGLCTGVIISPNTVLTAAHCVCPGNMVTAVEEGYVADSPDNIVHHVSEQKPMRPCNSSGSTAADVAIVRIVDSFSPDNPVILGSSETIDESTFVRAVGFGATENGSIGLKLYVDIPVATTNCSGRVKLRNGVEKTDASWYKCFSSFELVAGQPYLNKDTCHGDSGGPIFFHSDNGTGYDEFLVGITSRGIGSPGARDCGDGGIFERIDGPVLSFLKSQKVAFKSQK